MRYFIELSYCGANYAGWQIQPNAPSVQQMLNEALSTLLRTEAYVVGAGRTDAGVHAKQMFAHVDLEHGLDADALVFRLNRFLPADIAVQQIFPVADDAHARFSATSRSYQYWVSQRKNPFLSDFAWEVTPKLDIDAMNRAAQLLPGEKDFSAFARSGTQSKTNLCTVTQAVWEVQEERLIFHISANRFLRNMVRAIVGTLVAVGQNKCSLHRFDDIVKSKDRTQAGESAPAHGLYLTQVAYPPKLISNGKS
jgi:tRNA pseudouridine38-40 synthase